MKYYGEMLEGLEIIDRVNFKDYRGYFSETWKMNSDNMRGTYRQLNTACSSKHVIRGLHRQDQSKLVMPVTGLIFDVAVDPESKRWFGIELDYTRALLIPPKYAHGYLVLSDEAIVQYVVDMPYNKELEENFKWDQYGIDWPIDTKPVLSEKDS